MSWWKSLSQSVSHLRQALALTRNHSPESIQRALRGDVNPVNVQQLPRAKHLPVRMAPTEPGGVGPRKPFGLPYPLLRWFAIHNVYVRACINVRQREVGGANWGVVPSLEFEKKELETLRQLVQAAHRFEDRKNTLDDFKPSYIPKEMSKQLIDATLNPGLSDSEIRYRFQLAYLDLVMVAEKHAAPIRKLFQKPNDSKSQFGTLLRTMVEDILVIGKGYWERIRDLHPTDEFGLALPTNTIRELHWVDAATIRPCIDRHGELKGDLDPSQPSFEQWVDDQMVASFLSHELFRVMENPQTDVNFRGYPLSRVETLARMTLPLDAKGDKADLKEFDRAMYGGFLWLDDGSISAQEDLDLFRFRLDEAIAEFDIPLMAGRKGAKPEWVNTRMDTGGHDKTTIDKKKALVLKICACMGVPPVKVGVLEKATRATSETEKEMGDEDLINLLKIIEEGITVNIVQDEGFGGYTDIEAKALAQNDDEKEELERLQKELELCLITVNDARLERGKEPLANGDVSLPYFKKLAEQKAVNDARSELPQEAKTQEPDGGFKGNNGDDPVPVDKKGKGKNGEYFNEEDRKKYTPKTPQTQEVKRSILEALDEWEEGHHGETPQVIVEVIP